MYRAKSDHKLNKISKSDPSESTRLKSDKLMKLGHDEVLASVN
jgi:hypothetical protein